MDAPAATELELRFSGDGDGTRVELEHRGWERYAEKASEARLSYDSGWDRVLGAFDKEAEASPHE